MPSHYRLIEGTIEIDGVRMHQTASKTPGQDALDRVAALGIRKGERVLDVCTGLGYSAIAAARKGAKVVTIEKDENVLDYARVNDGSTELFENKSIEIIVADAFAVLPALPSSSFDKIIHDPPRLSMAGDLYSLEFYRQLYRVLRPRGGLFHYTGRPGVRSGKNIPKGIKQRLLEAGFVQVIWQDGLQGFVCRK